MSDVNMNAVKLNGIKDYVKANVALQCATLHAPRLAIQGAPGTGKSDIIREICEENGWTLTVKYLSNMSLEQITGIPCKVESGSTAIWSKPELFNFDNPEYATEKYLNGTEQVKNDTVKILLIDDFHLADRIMQRYLFQLLTYKSLNGYRLPPNTAILLAGNRNTDKALANPIPAPVCNRLLFMEVTSEAKDWLNNFAFKHDVREDVTSFIYNHEVCLSSEPLESGAWASPRSWTYLSEQMDAFEKAFGKLDITTLKNLASGLIGAEMTGKFIEYRELFAKWNFNKLFAGGIEAAKKRFADQIESNFSEVYAIISAASAWLLTEYRDHDYKSESDHMQKVVKFVYDTFIYLMLYPNNKVQRNTRPLLIAGTRYIQMYQDASKQKFGKNAKAPLLAFLDCMHAERDCDYIFYDLLATLLHLQLDDADKKAIAEAKKKLNYNM